MVLYVEDEDSDVLLLRLACAQAGVNFDLRSVSDGEQAIDYLAGRGSFTDRAQHPLPDLVLLDLNLPRRAAWRFSTGSAANLIWLACPWSSTLPRLMLTIAPKHVASVSRIMS